MELVYLWVKEYKNIIGQGFNFSPRFECEFKDGVLTIDKNKEHISIFPDNINITAIVGENGSGKSSSVLFMIKKIFDKNYDNSKDVTFFLIINDEQTIKIYKNNLTINVNSNILYEVDDFYNENIELKNDNIRNSIFFQFIDFSLTNNIINSANNYKKSFAIEPSTDYLGSGPGYTSKISTISFEAIMMGKSVSLYKFIDKNILNKLNIEKFDKIKLSATRYKKDSAYENFKTEIDILNKFYENNPDKTLLKIFTKQKFQECLNNKKFNGNNTVINLEDINDKDLEYLSLLDRFITIDLINDKNISYRDLSGGHKIFIGYFALIYKQLQILFRENKKDTILYNY